MSSVPLGFVRRSDAASAMAVAVGSFFIPLLSSVVQSLYRQEQPLRRLPSSAIRLLNEKIMKCWEGGVQE